MVNSKVDKIIIEHLTKLMNKNPSSFQQMTDKDKITYLQEQLKKNGLFVSLNSSEMKSFENLKKINDEMNSTLAELVNQINYSNNSTKLGRFAKNINRLLNSYIKLKKLLLFHKENLKPFEKLISKYVKKNPENNTRSKSKSKSKSQSKSKSPRNNTRKQNKKKSLSNSSANKSS